MKKNTTVILVECALMIAMSTVLSMFKIFELPQGGAVTCASMVPLVLVSYRHGLKWGISTAFAHSLLQMIIQFNAPPANTFGAFVAVVLLDYVLAFTVLGTAAFFGKPFKSRAASVAVGSVAVAFLRFLCSFLSGILIWGSYAPEGTPVWIYSLTYNGSYMLPEAVITAVVAVVLIRVLDRVEHRAPGNAS
ncbi:energy-coupled thiamine transporter ThiT [Clostridium sp. KNHs216]|uniref:energy-coupled thiamine transporter ThiT n=1 Tax=Eubacteriales TaxID=186802 RepID=UPI00115482E9|nr:energy-coupled thiamine transporter ThiT [Clostridium sp. KNHs216]TQI67526.1 thiamine transporter [Clostridium sp. KNHs216]